jgi:Mrp family chromosome partitioning ATPase
MVDRIRKALDMARSERARGGNEARSATVSEAVVIDRPWPTARAAKAERVEAAEPIRANPDSKPAANAPPAEITYTRTHVFAPAADILERNRVLNPSSADPAAVAFRMLRTQVLQRMDANGWRTLAVFSPSAKDGKTTTAINLAISLASDRLHTVLLVDFDFLHPSVAPRLGLVPELGGDDAMSGQARVEECLYHPEGFDRLVIMPARATLDNSSEMLAGPRSRALVAELRARYPERIVVFDLPPVLAADDALAFAPLVECGLVVASEGRTRRKDLVRTIELLHKTPLVGTALNRAADSPAGY